MFLLNALTYRSPRSISLLRLSRSTPAASAVAFRRVARSVTTVTSRLPVSTSSITVLIHSGIPILIFKP